MTHATGGIISVNEIYTIHTFNNGNFIPNIPLICNALLVGGGGAGGGDPN